MASIIKVDTIQSTTANVFILNSSGTEYARFNSTGVFQLANPITFPSGTAAAPSITATGDTNTGLYFPAADTIGFVEGGVESMRIDSSGNVGIGTSSPVARLQVGGGLSGSNATYVGDVQLNGNPINLQQAGGLEYKTSTFGSGYGWKISSIDSSGVQLVFGTRQNSATWTEAMRIDSSSNLQFNSGYGSVATAYGCRAWVNFNGTGVVAIRASGNVSSITDNGTGEYTVNFTTAMPDTNYSVSATARVVGDGGCVVPIPDTTNTTSAYRIVSRPTPQGSSTDAAHVYFQVFR